MCLIIFAYQCAERLPMVVAANRDEFYSRPSQPADFWTPETGRRRLLGGRDLQSGGTWLGVTENGRFAAVTNIRDPSRTAPKPRSRGALTTNFLADDETAQAYAESLTASFAEYAAYNLLLGDGESLVYVNSSTRRIESLAPGIYGLSNGGLNSDWPKTNRGRQALITLMRNTDSLSSDDLISMMADRLQAPDSQLPSTGLPRELERKLSPMFINDPARQYGTRCSTGLLQTASGELRFGEENFDQEGNTTSRHYFELKSNYPN